MPVDPFQGAQRLLGRGGDGAAVCVPGVEGLPGGEVRFLAPQPDGGLVASGALLGEENAEDFGGVPALRPRGRDHLDRGLAQVGQPQPAGQCQHLF